MNSGFFNNLQLALASERLDAYRQDGAQPLVTLARYLWNMAVCESLYSPLQIAEIALRNSLHRELSGHFGTSDWYDDIAAWNLLSEQQRSRIDEAKDTLRRKSKPITAGRVVAELTFGFWTAFFNKRFAQERTVVQLASAAFRSAPRQERDLRKLNRRWGKIREIRNRVFHHERIIHWTDLDRQHAEMLETTLWLSPHLEEMARALDRFSEIRHQGLDPWIAKIRQHWPQT